MDVLGVAHGVSDCSCRRCLNYKRPIVVSQEPVVASFDVSWGCRFIDGCSNAVACPDKPDKDAKVPEDEPAQDVEALRQAQHGALQAKIAAKNACDARPHCVHAKALLAACQKDWEEAQGKTRHAMPKQERIKSMGRAIARYGSLLG